MIFKQVNLLGTTQKVASAIEITLVYGARATATATAVAAAVAAATAAATAAAMAFTRHELAETLSTAA